MNTENSRAKAWRVRHKLTQADLADLVGWTEATILLMERGVTSQRGGGEISPWVWQRYKRACQGVEAQLRGMEFDW